MKRILITRPKNQARELVKALESQETEVFVEPIFEIEELEVKKPAQNFSALIITSTNACFALRELQIPKEMPIFIVGKKTAQKLRTLGYNNVILSSENSAQSLTDAVEFYDGQILYLRGEKISFDFAGKYNNICEILVYKVKENESFSSEFLEFCQKNSFDEVLLLSQNSADLFFRLLKRHNLLESFLSAKIVCLSKKILEAASGFGFTKITTFDHNQILKKFYD
jgi:uroporphyrinogen-III synthase